MSQRDPHQYLPLKPDVLAVLMILVDGDTHGYGIIKEAARRTDGRMQLQAGALYRRLKWMLAEGLIEELEPNAVSDDGDRRRTYGVTPLGRAVAGAEAERMAIWVAAAEARRLIKGSVR